MIEYSIWKKNILDNIKEISDLKLQYRVWVEGDNNYFSSYAELMSQLFDNNYFDDFILQNKNKLDSHLLEKLQLLNKELNSYNEGCKSDADIINDPEWQKISSLAKDILDYWKKIDNADESI